MGQRDLGRGHEMDSAVTEAIQGASPEPGLHPGKVSRGNVQNG